MVPAIQKLSLTLEVVLVSISLNSCFSSFPQISPGEYVPAEILQDAEGKTFDKFIIKLEQISKEEFKSRDSNAFEDPWSQRNYHNEDRFLTFDLWILDEESHQSVLIECYGFSVEQIHWKTFEVRVEDNIFGLVYIRYTPLDNNISFTVEKNEMDAVTEYQLERLLV